MRKLAYYVATTVDGFIAHEDGSLDGFLMEGDHAKDFLESLQSFDTVLMGRATYDLGRRFGVTNPYPTMKQYVFSRTLHESPDPAVKLVSENVPGVVRELKTQLGKDIWLCGGANLASALFAEGLIDEVIVKTNPVLFGTGKPLFSGGYYANSVGVGPTQDLRQRRRRSPVPREGAGLSHERAGQCSPLSEAAYSAICAPHGSSSSDRPLIPVRAAAPRPRRGSGARCRAAARGQSGPSPRSPAAGAPAPLRRARRRCAS